MRGNRPTFVKAFARERIYNGFKKTIARTKGSGCGSGGSGSGGAAHAAVSHSGDVFDGAMEANGEPTTGAEDGGVSTKWLELEDMDDLVVLDSPSTG